MEEKMVIVKFVFVEYALRQPGKIGFQAFCAHEVGQFDMIKTVIIRHVGS